jgi:hypothetical protein
MYITTKTRAKRLSAAVAVAAMILALAAFWQFGVRDTPIRPSASQRHASAPPATAPAPSSPSATVTTPAAPRTTRPAPAPQPSTVTFSPVPPATRPAAPPPPRTTPARPSASPRPTPTQTFVPTTADLQAALLTPAQLPGGTYTPVPPADGTLGPGSFAGCPALSAGQSGVTAQASEFLMAGQAGPFIDEALLQDSVSGAEQMVSALTAVASCGAIPLTVAGTTLDVTLAPESFPALGDQQAAVAVNVSVPGGSTTVHIGDIAAVRHGGTVIEVTNVGFPLNGPLTAEVATDALAKVAARW